MLSGLLLVFTIIANAQTKRDSLMIGTGLSKDLLGNNEIKFNFFMAIAGLAEISYERIIHDEHAVGVSLFAAAFENTNLKYGAFPYYRFYFGARKASGFFLEGSAAIFRYGYSSGKASYYIDAAGNTYPISELNETVLDLVQQPDLSFWPEMDLQVRSI